MSTKTEDLKAAIALLDLAMSVLERAENEAGAFLNHEDRLARAKTTIGKCSRHLVRMYDIERRKE